MSVGISEGPPPVPTEVAGPEDGSSRSARDGPPDPRTVTAVVLAGDAVTTDRQNAHRSRQVERAEIGTVARRSEPPARVGRCRRRPLDPGRSVVADDEAEDGVPPVARHGRNDRLERPPAEGVPAAGIHDD